MSNTHGVSASHAADEVRGKHVPAPSDFGEGRDVSNPRTMIARWLGGLGVVLAVVYWLIDGAIDTWLFGGSFLGHLLPAEFMEYWERGFPAGLLVAGGVISALFMERLIRLERRNQQLHRQLESALTKLMSGFVPICMYCKNIRDEQEQWKRVEEYMASRTDLKFSHGICPQCFAKYFPDDGVADGKSDPG